MKPLIAVTMGDPAGIGPEIVARSLVEPRVSAAARVVVVGDAGVMREACRICGIEADIHLVRDCREGRYERGTINLVESGALDCSRLIRGAVHEACGRAAYESIAVAARLALEHRVDAVATAPINKESLRAARIEGIGHTEILSALTASPDPLTLFEVQELRVFFFSRHVSLREACDLVKRERLLAFLERCTRELRRIDRSEAPLAVAGLNPHCGENGRFGREEIEEIVPAVADARRRGINVVGPIGADSVFHQALNGRYAAVVALYHDQGHVATKTLDFERTVAITLGLPFLRTSVDHGTAFDIAGQGAASAVSMVEAVLKAARYAPLFAA